MSTKRIPINNKENQRSLMTEGEYIWEEMQATTKKRRQKKFGPDAVGDNSSSDSSGAKDPREKEAQVVVRKEVKVPRAAK